MYIMQFEKYLFYLAIIPLIIVIIVIIVIIIFFVKLLTLDNIVKKAGKNYFMVKLKTNHKTQMFLFVWIIILNVAFIFSIIILIIFSFDIIIVNLIIITFLLTVSFIIIYLFDKKKNKNTCGLFENGIIDENYEFIEWKDVHSYIIIDNDLFGYYKDGNAFNYKNIMNIEEIKYLLYKNGIKERKEK